MRKTILLLSLFCSIFAMGQTSIPTDTYMSFPLDGNAMDVGGNNYSGTITGGVTPVSDRFGNASGAMQFDGTGYIDIPYTTGVGTADFTVSYWACPGPGNTADSYVFTKDQTGDGNSQFRFGSSGGAYSFDISDASNVVEGKLSYTPAAGAWAFYTVIRKADVFSLYVDGVLQSSVATTAIINSANSYNYRIGSRFNTNDNFIGKIDDLRMFHHALSADEINALYTYTNNALSFDGVNDFVSLPTLSTTTDFSKGFSYTGWIKWNSFNNYSRLLDIGNGENSNNIVIANFSTNNQLVIHSIAGNSNLEIHTDPILVAGQWVHVGLTIGSTGQANIYINGVLVTSGVINIPRNIERTRNYLGKSNWDSDPYFNGSMDEVSIWSKELSLAEITTAMNTGFQGTESNLVAYYRFNQGVADSDNTGVTTLADGSVSGNPGTLNGFALAGTTSNWVSGFLVPSNQIPPGTTCETAITSVKGINHSTHQGANDNQWFTYTAASDCMLTISSLGLTACGNTFDILDDCSNKTILFHSQQYGNTNPMQSKRTFQLSKGQSVLIRWNSSGQAASYNWQLSEMPLPAGSTYATAIPAVIGINSMYHYNTTVDQWYTYTPEEDGVLKINQVIPLGGRQVNFNGLVYESADLINSIAEVYSHKNSVKDLVAVKKGVTYALFFDKWNNEDQLTWTLSFSAQPYVVELGTDCSTPMIVRTGLNTASNVKGNQWYSYTPTKQGVMTLSTCGLTEEDTHVQVFEDCASSSPLAESDDDCLSQSHVVLDLVKDKTYLINWNNDYTSATYPWSFSFRPYSSADDILSFGFTGLTVSSTVNAASHTVQVVVGKHQDISGLTAAFQLSEGATAAIAGNNQVSDNTTNNFTTSLTYTITAEDGSTQDWIINVSNALELSSGKAIISYAFNDLTHVESTELDAVNHTVKVYADYNIQDANLIVAGFTLSSYATASVGGVLQESGTSLNDFSTPKIYTITAEDGTTQDWTIELVLAAKPKGESCSDPILATAGANLSDKVFDSHYYQYTPTKREVIGLGYCSSDGSYREANVYSDCPSTTILGKGYVDCYNELKVVVEKDVPVYIQWIGLKGDSWKLTQYSPLEKKQILNFSVSYSVNSVVIDTLNHTVHGIVGLNTDLTKLPIFFTLSQEATAFIGSVQVYTGNSLDFTTPKTMTIVAQDGTTQDYTVSFAVREVNTGNSITGFFLEEQSESAIIDAIHHTVIVHVVAGTNFLGLVPKFVVSNYADVKVGSYAQNSNNSVVDFTNPVTYSVTSESGVKQDWIVTVTDKNAFADFTTFGFNEQTQSAVIDASNKTITVSVAPGTNRAVLVPAFTASTGATIRVGSVDQVSGTTANDFTTPVVYEVTSEDGFTTTDWTVIVQNPEADVTAFHIAGQTSSAINAGSKTISVTMPYGVSVTSLVAGFTLSDGATATVGTMAQVSGTTAIDFNNPVVYKVLAQDGVSTQAWTVTVTVAKNSAASVISYHIAGETSSAINAGSKTISVTMPYGASVTSLVAGFTLSDGATATVGTMAQVSGTTAIDFNNPVVYKVLAQDGISTQAWTVTVTVAKNSAASVISYHIAGETSSAINAGSKTISVTMPYGASVTSLVAGFTLSDGATATVGTVAQVSGTTAIDFSHPVVYKVLAQDGTSTQEWTVTVMVAKNSAASVISYHIAGETSSAINAGSKTISVAMLYGASVTSLVAGFTLSDGATATVGTMAQVSGTTAIDFNNPVVYKVLAQDGVSTQEWRVTVTVAKNSAASVISYHIAGETSSAINAGSKTISVAMPYGASVTSLVASFTLSDGATATVGTVAQVSGTTAIDFNNPVVYKVLAQDGISTQEWRVTVTVAKNSAASVTSYHIARETSSIINAAGKTIAVTMPHGTSVSNLSASFTLSDGATATVGTIAQVSGTTAIDFNNPVVYTVLAQDGVTVQNWTVRVAVEIATGIYTQHEATGSIYPNPATNGFTINLGDKTTLVSICDLSGSMILSQEGIGKTYIDISMLAKGVYVVRTNGLIEKLVKK